MNELDKNYTGQMAEEEQKQQDQPSNQQRKETLKGIKQLKQQQQQHEYKLDGTTPELEENVSSIRNRVLQYMTTAKRLKESDTKDLIKMYEILSKIGDDGEQEGNKPKAKPVAPVASDELRSLKS